MARPTNFGYDRFGGTNLDKPQTRTTTAQLRNQANTDKYRVDTDRADDRFRTGGGMYPDRGLPKKTGSFKFPLGLLGGRGGRGDNIKFAEEDYQRQLDLMDKIAEMSAGYSTYGTLGDTIVDYEGKKVTQRLSPELQAQYDSLIGASATSRERAEAMRANPELQAQYDALLGDYTTSRERAAAMRANPELQAQSNALLARSGLSADRVAAMGANPYEMQQYLYDQNLALKQPEQEKLRTQTQEALAAKGMLGSTGGAGLYGEVEDSIQRSNAQDFADAMAQSQQMLDMERARGSQDLSQSQQIREWSDRMMDAERGRGQQDFSAALQLKDYQQGLLDAERARGSQDFATATALGGLQVPWADLGRAHGQGTHTKNVEGVSGASRNIFGQQAMQSLGKAKQKQGIWDMLLGGSGGGLLGGLW